MIKRYWLVWLNVLLILVIIGQDAVLLYQRKTLDKSAAALRQLMQHCGQHDLATVVRRAKTN